MKKFEVYCNDVDKARRVTIILQRLADMFDKYGEVEITVKVKDKKRWWKI